MSVRNRRLATPGVIAAGWHAFLAGMLAATTAARRDRTLSHSIRVMRPATAGTAANGANRGRHHRRSRPGPAGGVRRRLVG